VFAFSIGWSQEAPQRHRTSSEKGIVNDKVVVDKVLKEVKTYVLRITRDRRRPLVVKEGKKSRRFIVVEFLGAVTRNENVYTAEIDADEFDHKIRRILYVDLQPYRKTFRIKRIRIGPNHFRN